MSEACPTNAHFYVVNRHCESSPTVWDKIQDLLRRSGGRSGGTTAETVIIPAGSYITRYGPAARRRVRGLFVQEMPMNAVKKNFEASVTSA